MVVEILIRLRLMEAVLERDARGQGVVQIFLIDRDGSLLWSEGATARRQTGRSRSPNLVRDFARKPLNLTAEYDLESEQRLGGDARHGEPGGRERVGRRRPPAGGGGLRVGARAWSSAPCWRPCCCFCSRCCFAIYASRWLGQPIRQLSETAHSMASGNFGERLPEQRLVAELADLSADFNLMAGYVEDHVAQAQRSGAAEPRAVHQLDPRLRGRDRRQGPLHPRPLRARRRALAADRQVARAERGVPAQALDRRAAARRRQDRHRRPGAEQERRADRRRSSSR